MNEGNAIINNTTAGKIVQMISIVCPCTKYLCGKGFLVESLTILNNAHETTHKIKTK
jgi:hypothetical protein